MGRTHKSSTSLQNKKRNQRGNFLCLLIFLMFLEHAIVQVGREEKKKKRSVAEVHSSKRSKNLKIQRLFSADCQCLTFCCSDSHCFNYLQIFFCPCSTLLSLVAVGRYPSRGSFRIRVKLRGLCPWGRTSEHVSC